jgi:hypothetical protein
VVVDRAARTLSGLAVAYPAPRGAHPLTGHRAPDISVHWERTQRPERLYEALRTARFVLVAPAGRPESIVDTVDVVTPNTKQTAMLVRPDGYIAWAGTDGLPEALRRWCGPA